MKMPDHDIEIITSEQLHGELRKSHKNFIILDCRSSNEFTESHIRTAVNFSIPSIMLRRFAAGKIDITSTIKCRDLKERILSCYKESTFVLYNNSNDVVINDPGYNNQTTNDTTINVLHRKLKQDGCRVVCLEGGYANFRQSFPEWCEDEVINANLQSGCAATEQLMGLRSLRISIPFSDSACSSSTESSDCESTTNYHHLSEPVNVEPVEIMSGLFLGNASHSEDLKSLKKYNIKYILNVTPDLPNVFERDGHIKYLQIPITDHWSQDLAGHFPNAIKFIDEARSKGAGVLVHCLAGVSRSVTVTLAYIMFTRTLSLNDAFSLVRARKPDVSPNFHFMEQLHSFERQLNIDANQRAKLLSGVCSSASTPSSSSAVSCGGGAFPSTSSTSSGLGGSSLSRHTSGDQPPGGSFDRGPGSSGPRTHMGKYSCTCFEVECKCTQAAIELLGPFSSGISPDSGIEFDRWTPSSNTPK
ncbi:dual specificity protein phosphatase Mpk3 [Uranotaenia lowii]|uniref:dual specificity protein phosphatase Mpk3 n=1 Tax=Uranotaenia lowii TaxID=190385 RepID=UPI002479CF4D|nr:dual specificity protein phosphatase Mpk3 [Uranotaenia lowii]XP_055600936.1 dual specificity protein phosphatase Mpk3 [Uranotaenia lowii]